MTGLGLEGIAVGMAGGRSTKLPPWLFPPEDARMVDLTTEAPAPISALGVGSVIDFVVPERLLLTIRGVGFGAADPTDTLHATWSVRVSGEILEGYHYLPAVIGHIDEPAEVLMLIEPGKTLSIEVTNGSAAMTSIYSGRIVGWLYDPTRGGA